MAALLAAGRSCQCLEVEAAGDRHDADRELAVDVGDEGLEDPLGRHAERLAGLLAVRRVPRVVAVAVDRVRDAEAR